MLTDNTITQEAEKALFDAGKYCVGATVRG